MVTQSRPQKRSILPIIRQIHDVERLPGDRDGDIHRYQKFFVELAEQRRESRFQPACPVCRLARHGARIGWSRRRRRFFLPQVGKFYFRIPLDDCPVESLAPSDREK